MKPGPVAPPCGGSVAPGHHAAVDVPNRTRDPRRIVRDQEVDRRCDVFRSAHATDRMKAVFQSAGADPSNAEDDALAMLGCLEGGLLVARASGQITAFDRIAHRAVVRLAP